MRKLRFRPSNGPASTTIQTPPTMPTTPLATNQKDRRVR
jgi:hypothetical protein